MTWNVFRTLELIAPSFWLRRFRARLDAVTSLEAGGPSLSVHLWAVLPTPAERWRQEPVRVDALTETDTAVYGVMTMDGADVELGDSTLARPDAILRVIDSLTDLERFAASRTERWLDSLGIHPTD